MKVAKKPRHALAFWLKIRMPFILGTKLGMTQVFQENGTAVPATIVESGGCVVIQVRTKEKDGYEAVQIGFGEKKKINKPMKGHLKDAGNFRHLKEFKIKAGDFSAGDKIEVNIFKPGDSVKVSSVSKAKGFQGVVKRHGFAGGPASHGHKHNLRAPGSIGSTWPQRVIKGMRMAGRMGGEAVSVRNLKIVKIDEENKLIAVSGAIPGRNGALVEIVGMK